MTAVLRQIDREIIRETIREVEIRVDRSIQEPRPWPIERKPALGLARKLIEVRPVLLLTDRRQGDLFR